jgi:hypothetical protein
MSAIVLQNRNLYFLQNIHSLPPGWVVSIDVAHGVDVEKIQIMTLYWIFHEITVAVFLS